jgi:hypothetical protein
VLRTLSAAGVYHRALRGGLKARFKNNLLKFLLGGVMVSAEHPDEVAMMKLQAALAAINQPHLLLDGQGTSSTRPVTDGTLDGVSTQIRVAREVPRQPKGRAIEEAPGNRFLPSKQYPRMMALAIISILGLPVAELAGGTGPPRIDPATGRPYR